MVSSCIVCCRTFDHWKTRIVLFLFLSTRLGIPKWKFVPSICFFIMLISHWRLYCTINCGYLSLSYLPCDCTVCILSAALDNIFHHFLVWKGNTTILFKILHCRSFERILSVGSYLGLLHSLWLVETPVPHDLEQSPQAPHELQPPSRFTKTDVLFTQLPYIHHFGNKKEPQIIEVHLL